MVYFIQAESGGPIKIGYTNDLERRMFELQEGNPEKLVCLATLDADQKTEYRLHRKFEKHKYRSEWFQDCEEIREFIKNLDSFDAIELFFEQKPKSNPKVRNFNYHRFFDEFEYFVYANNWTLEESMKQFESRMVDELMKFGHTKHRAERLMNSYKPILDILYANARNSKESNLFRNLGEEMFEKTPARNQ